MENLIYSIKVYKIDIGACWLSGERSGLPLKRSGYTDNGRPFMYTNNSLYNVLKSNQLSSVVTSGSESTIIMEVNGGKTFSVCFHNSEVSYFKPSLPKRAVERLRLNIL